MNETLCGNPHHPRGPWHVATPMSLSLREQLRQWLRKRTWGCPCRADAHVPGVRR